jgi:NlpC/P60 family putative phage cell wall peptidase
MSEIRNDIVTQARTWKGTRFHHQARLKGVGCDCLGLGVGVAQELDLRDAQDRPLTIYDEADYSKAPNGEYLTAKLDALFPSVPFEEMAAGDLALFLIDGNPQHLAILSDFEGGLGMIHCYAQARGVVEHRLDDEWKSKLVKVYRWQP